MCGGWMESGHCVRGGEIGLVSVSVVVGSPGVVGGVAAEWVVLMGLSLRVVVGVVRV